MEHCMEQFGRRYSESDNDNNNDNNNVNDNDNNNVNTNVVAVSEVIVENKEEKQYLGLLRHIVDGGVWETSRNGRTRTLFGNMMRFSLADGRIPILTTKKTAWKTCLRELLWFVRGETDNRTLKEQGVHIWDANASRSFLDSRNLSHYQEDELGPIYGYQWRHFNQPYVPRNVRESTAKAGTKAAADSKATADSKAVADLEHPENTGIDQLQQIIAALQDETQRSSRRLVLTAWNPQQLDEMALPPCHVLCQFHVQDGTKLCCAMYQRSADCFLGVPFNIASYAFLTHLLAVHCGLVAHEFVYFMGNCHLYENAIEAAKQQCTRVPFAFPTVSISRQEARIEDYTVEHFTVSNYCSHPAIKVDMIA